MSASSPMKQLLAIGRRKNKWGVYESIVAVYWAGKRFTRQGIYVWFFGRYIIAGQRNSVTR